MTGKKAAATKAASKKAPPKGEGASSPIELDRFLPFRFAVLSTGISRGLAEVYGDRFQLTIADWRILANLGHAGPLYAGELAERSSLDKPKVTRALQRLEAAGVIVRAVDLEDRRQTRLSLTDKGRNLYQDVARIALAWEAELLSPLTPADRTALQRVLEKLQRRVDEMRRNYAALAAAAKSNLED